MYKTVFSSKNENNYKVQTFKLINKFELIEVYFLLLHIKRRKVRLITKYVVYSN